MREWGSGTALFRPSTFKGAGCRFEQRAAPAIALCDLCVHARDCYGTPIAPVKGGEAGRVISVFFFL